MKGDYQLISIELGRAYGPQEKEDFLRLRKSTLLEELHAFRSFAPSCSTSDPPVDGVSIFDSNKQYWGTSEGNARA